MPESLIYKLVNMQIDDPSEWKIESFSVEGEGEMNTTFSAPNSYLYVTIPDEDSVEEAKEKIQAILHEG